MAHARSKYADCDGLRERAVALRRAGLSLRQIREELQVRNNDTLQRLVAGEPPPEWTRRPNAKDALRERARELRRQGRTYSEIQAELGCSKSSVSLWVRDLPRPEPRCTPEEQRARMNAGLERLRAERDQARKETKQKAAESIGDLSERELFMAGVALYWAEGQKSKPYQRRETVAFVNSDPAVIQVYLAWLDLLDVPRERLRLRVMIHETADVEAAERYWAALTGIDVADLLPTTLKKHNAKTVRKNVGDTYRGCLVIRVLQGAELYCRIEGWWSGIVAHTQTRLG